MAMLSIALISTHSPGIDAESQSLSLGHELDAVSSAEADMMLGGYATVRNARLLPAVNRDSESVFSYLTGREETSLAETAPHTSNNALESDGADDFAPQSTSGAASASDASRIYLEKTIPPCTLVTVPGKDPCETREEVARIIGEPSPFPVSYELKHYSDYLDKSTYEPVTAHMALRGTALPNTVRCLREVPVKAHDHSTDTANHRLILEHDGERIEATKCFMDVAVQEYIIGKGAPTVTLEMFDSWLSAMSDRGTIDYGSFFGWNHLRTYEDLLAVQLEKRYAGSEHLFFISPSDEILIESWDVIADFDVVRNDPPFDLPPWLKHYGGCETDLCAHDRFMNTIYEYPEIISGMRRHHQALVEKYGGFISSEPGIARLVLDTYDLENHFRAVGAYGYTDIVPAPPPPLPGIPVASVASYDLTASATAASETPPRPKRSASLAESVSLNWSPVPRAVKYRLEGREEGAYDWIVHRDDLTEPSHTVHGLKCGTQYHFRFRAFGDDWDIFQEDMLPPIWTPPFGPVSATTAPCVRTP